MWHKAESICVYGTFLYIPNILKFKVPKGPLHRLYLPITCKWEVSVSVPVAWNMTIMKTPKKELGNV